jgi:acylphosphatase
MIKRLQITVTGPRVQGVGFRFEAHLQMVDLGLTGTAENSREGGVVLEAQGEEAALEKLVTWAKQGPEGARVGNVTVNEIPVVTEPAK